MCVLWSSCSEIVYFFPTFTYGWPKDHHLMIEIEENDVNKLGFLQKRKIDKNARSNKNCKNILISQKWGMLSIYAETWRIIGIDNWRCRGSGKSNKRKWRTDIIWDVIAKYYESTEKIGYYQDYSNEQINCPHQS